MGIQIKGSNDTISASDGSMVLEGSALTFDNESITGISTMATGHITGTATIDDALKVGISTLFVDKSTGRTGIGPVNPNKILTVRGSSTPEILLKPYDASPAIYVGDTIRTGAGQHLAEYRGNWNGTTVGRMVFAAGADTTNKDDGRLVLYTATGGTMKEHFRIDENGKTTIGGGIQDQQASEFNSGANQLLITSNGATGLTIDATSSTSSSIHFADGATGSESYRGIIEYNHSSDYMSFATSGSHVARITSTGQVGVNTSTFNTGSKLESSSEGAYNIVARSQNGNGGYHNFTGQSSGGTNTSYITHNGRGYFEDGVQFDTSGEVLDSYEEGTVTWASPNNGDISFDSNYKGRYTKIGELVTVSGYILVDSYTSSGTAIRITMPFTSAANSEGYYTRGVGATFNRYMNFPANYENMVAYVGGGEDYMRFFMSRTTGGSSEWHQMRAQDFTSTTGIYFNVCYTTTS